MSDENNDYRGIFTGYFFDIQQVCEAGQTAASTGDWGGVQKATEEITHALKAITDYLGHGTAEAEALQAVFDKAIKEIEATA